MLFQTLQRILSDAGHKLDLCDTVWLVVRWLYSYSALGHYYKVPYSNLKLSNLGTLP